MNQSAGLAAGGQGGTGSGEGDNEQTETSFHPTLRDLCLTFRYMAEYFAILDQC